MTDHPTLEELAEAAESLLVPERAAWIEAHLPDCPDCRHRAAELDAVQAKLAAAPAPVMPAGIANRLDRVLAAEGSRRSQPRIPRVTLGNFGVDRPRRATRRWLVPALAAAGAAAIVGFGAYVASASAGLNEPPVVAAVSTRDLGVQAAALEQASGLDPHRFSRAWQCARQVTEGRIVGLAVSNVDGTPALLVYTRSSGSTQVTVVTGCAVAAPSAGPSALVSR